MKCPFYQEVTAEILINNVKGYCLGYQEGKLRIPSVHEEKNLCLSENYHKCQVYKVRSAKEGKGILQKEEINRI